MVKIQVFFSYFYKTVGVCSMFEVTTPKKINKCKIFLYFSLLNAPYCQTIWLSLMPHWAECR